ncbi:hypothetical protein HanPSC8_Chr10g0414881 [Helianthus annuus]|nr:hypothetical protein HanPSC8_Chr10g0414881 [Helianthus annuus]
MWCRHSKVPLNILFGISTLLMTHKHKSPAIYCSNSRHYCWIIIARPVTMKLNKLNVEYVIKKSWSVRVSCNIDSLYWSQMCIEIFKSLQKRYITIKRNDRLT